MLETSDKVVWLVGATAVALAVWTLYRARPGTVLWRLGTRRLATAPLEVASAIGAVALAVSLLFAAVGIGESLRASLVGLERSRLGPIDVSITLRGPASREGASRIREVLADRGVATATTFRALQVTAVVPAKAVTEPESRKDFGEDVLAEPLAVAYDYRYGELDAFSKGSEHGLPASGPEPGSAYLSLDLARRLGVNKGDEIGLVIGSRREKFVVSQILRSRGLAGYSQDFEAPIFSVFLPEKYLDNVPAVTEVLINVGTESGSEPGSAVAKAEPEITALKDVFDSLAQRGTRPIVKYQKAELARAARRLAGSQTSQLLQLGSFALFSALGLLGSVLYLVLAERKRFFGVVSAVGMRKKDIAASNNLTALFICLPGILLGIALGSGIVWVAVRVAGAAVSVKLASFEAYVSIPPYLVILTAASGVLVTGLLSRITSGLLLSSHPAELITGRERPLRLPTAIVLAGGMAMIALGSGGTALDLRAKTPTFTYLGPALVAGGVSLFLSLSKLRRTIAGIAGTSVVGWIVFVEARWASELQPPEFGALPIIVVATFLMGAVAAVVSVLGPLEWLLSALLDWLGAGTVSLRAAARNLSDRRGATWFVVQTSAAAVAVLAMVAGFFSLEQADLDRFEQEQLGGWIGVVSLRPLGSEDPAPAVARALAASGLERPERVKTLYSTQKFMRAAAGGRQLTRVYEIPREIAQGNGDGFLPLRGRNAKFSSDEEAWAALFDESSPDGRRWVIMSEGAVDLGFASPASAVLSDPETDTYFNLAGVTARNDLIPGIYVGQGAMENSGDQFQPTTVLFATPSEPSNVSKIEATVQGQLLEFGARVQFVSVVVKQQLQVRSMVSAMLRVFLSLGIVVAMAAQAAVITRAVRARSKSLAILRAMGASRSWIFRSVAAEGVAMACMGSVVGSAVGSLVAARFFVKAGGSVSLSSIAWTSGLLVLASAVVVGAVSLLPASAAAKTYPAQVLRNPQE